MTDTAIGPPRQPAAPAAGGETGPRPASSRPRLYVLDGLRLVAALGVVLFHWVGVQSFPAVWRGQDAKLMPFAHLIGSYGWTGVELFFLISGFVICMSCWGKSVGDFAASRVARLFPAYWFGVLLTSAVLLISPTVWGADTSRPTASRIFSNLTMLNDPLNVDPIDPVYWTLSAELRFYVLFGLVLATGLTYRKVVAFCGLWALAAAFTPKADMPLLEIITQSTYAWYFIAGMVMYLMYRFKPNLLLWGLLGICWLMAQERIRWVIDANHYATWHHLSWSLTIAAITVYFVLVLGAALGWFDRVQWTWLTFAGALTYPLYLVHQEIGWELISWLRGRGLAPYPTLVCSLATMLVAAWLIHRTVERPLAPIMSRAMKASFAQVRDAAGSQRR
ncbi:peptidoglycan/LPS O-acetylase OafA/YrhL [Kitasatospora sp. MAP12-15]|uniref:acyltransferase family protein n=1 Tax=unclassified Kitasatospora TaxID=2633591 RepID=UPI002473D8AF|nr:acyltransferase [Kitasatospora sp. MAP12-44]MDH6110930.1 peptidoglycan/LPS O-acetylase OafA/YrhL [Kitasatospora sp. MAP12-44]